MGEEAEQQAAALPLEGVIAFLEFMTALSLNPWGFADETGATMPTIAFCEGRGMVTVLIMSYRRELVITKIQWLG